MTAIVTLLVTLTIALLVTRVGASALKLTGISEDIARFQARSAFTGVGFTTRESEKIVNHPVRRRIVGLLMLSGNLGIAAVIASMMAAFSSGDQGDLFWTRVIIVSTCFVALWLISSQKWVDRAISGTIEWALRTWTNVDSADYVSLLRLSDGYVVVELEVREEDWVSNKTLAELGLAFEGVLVLGILRQSGNYIGSPNGTTELRAGDTITVYGMFERLEELNIRRSGFAGDIIHHRAIVDHEEMERKKAVVDSIESPPVDSDSTN